MRSNSYTNNDINESASSSSSSSSSDSLQGHPNPLLSALEAYKACHHEPIESVVKTFITTIDGCLLNMVKLKQ